MRTNRILIALIVVPMMFSACNSLDQEVNDESSRIRFLLTDAPGDYQAVNIDVRSVRVIINDSIIDLETNQGVYNLLDFVNGKDTLIVNDEIPAGMLSQVRLVLGENNSVVRDSLMHGMMTPSAQESGLKFNVHQEITPGTTYTYVIDFDASKSIVRTGNEKFILKPVIHVFTEAGTGSIEGVVQPPEASPAVMAIGPADEGDTATVFADTVSGEFMIRGLSDGYYDVEFHPEMGFDDTTLVDVQVVAGESTRLDTLWFQ